MEPFDAVLSERGEDAFVFWKRFSERLVENERRRLFVSANVDADEFADACSCFRKDCAWSRQDVLDLA